MKSPAFLALLTLSVPLCAADPALGATFAEVRTALGLPKGLAQAGERQLLYYDRGQVELSGGRVSRVALRTPEAQAAHESKIAASEARLREENEQRRARLKDEGEALKAAKLADDRFAAAPLAYQVSFWEDFARKYPGVDCREPLTIARLQLAEHLEEKRERAEQAARLAELEARFAEAESRASYVAYAGRGYGRRWRDRHDDRPFTVWPVEYRFYDSPQPYATSPTLPIFNLPQPVSIHNPRGEPPDRGHGRDGDHPGRGHGRGQGNQRCM